MKANKIKKTKAHSLEKKIRDKTARIGIIGLGYVGLPLAVAFAREGFNVTGIEQDRSRIISINSGKNYIGDIDNSELKALVKSKKLRATDDPKELEHADAICICVPTPLDKNKQPDISFVTSTAEKLSKIVHKDQLIILESTTYPGTTEEVLKPMLERSGLKAGQDFFLAFSPERVDPGNKKFNIKNITKVVGGINEKSTGLAALLYGQVVDEVHKVSSPRVAEIEKLLENVFRSVNIALVNELSILCKKMDIDIWEVIDAAKTKPYGFMPFYPGPGIGGHCIPLDPFYLAWKAREYGINAKFIELAGEINDRMPKYVVELIQNSLNKKGKAVKGSNIVVYGVAYKKDISDQRESPSLKIIELLIKNGAKLSYNDSYVPKIHLNGTVLHSRDMKAIKDCDCAVIATDHSYYDYEAIVKNASLVIDTRNATNGIADRSGKIVKI